MKKITLMTAVITALVGVAGAATIYDATIANTTLVDNGAGGSGAITLMGAPGNLVVTNANGNFNMGGFASTEDINTQNGAELTAYDTVTMKLTIDSITGNFRANGVQFGMSEDTLWPVVAVNTNDLIFGIRAGNSGSDVQLRFAGPAFENVGFDAQQASVLDGFSMEIIANAAGYTMTLTDILVKNSTVAGINNDDTSATVTGSFSGTEFVDMFGGGHMHYTAQKWNKGVPLVSTISEASIAVDIQEDPSIAVVPNLISFDLFAPDTSIDGTIGASYSAGANSSSDIEIVSLVASNGFSASMVNTILGLSNTDEDITVTFTNSVGLSEYLETTNSTLVVTWTEVGSGVTNTTDVALGVTYIPEQPSTPEHGLVLFDATTGNTTLFNNGVSGDASNLSLSGATPDLLLANDGGDFFAGGFASTDTINTLNGAAVTDEDTVMISLAVDSVTHTDLSQLRSRGIEFGMSAEAIMSGGEGGSTNNFIVEVGGAGNANNIRLADLSGGTITSAVFRATEASVADGFRSVIVADKDGFTIYFEGLEAENGYVRPVSGTFTNGHFASAFGSGHYYTSMQKRLVGTTTLDISEATLSVSATEAPEIIGSGVTGANFFVEFTGTLGREYSVETKGDLVNGLWGTATNIPSLPETPMSVELPTTDPAAFYRVVTP